MIDLSTRSSRSAPPVVVLRLGGRGWKLPKLAFKQLRHLAGRMDRAADRMAAGRPLLEVTGHDFDDLAESVYVALTRAAPELSWAEFETLEAGLVDLLAAFAVVYRSAIGTG